MHSKKVLPHYPGLNAYVGGVVNWRTRLLHWVATCVGLKIHLEGFPLGTSRNLLKDANDVMDNTNGK